MFDQNKPRLYMALYPIGDDQRSDVKYHTALIYVPKNPNVSRKESVMYHMRNDMKGSSEVWRFERKEVYNRTWNLLSVALLGKVKKDFKEADLHNLLKDVPRHDGERCRHWAWRAIGVRYMLYLRSLLELVYVQVLADNGIIEQTNGQELWNKLNEFTKKQTFDAAHAVPAIDKNGNAITSEIGPQK